MTGPKEENVKARKGFLPIAFLTTFLDMLGVTIVIPVLALLFVSDAGILAAGTPAATRTLLLGLLIAAYPLAQFFGAPILGALSDRHGRKPILIVSLAGSAIGWALFALGVMTHNLSLLFVGRIIDGFTGGNISIVMSAIADVSKPEEKARNFGLVGMAFGLGFIIGPFIGGKLSDPTLVSWFSMATPFWATVLLTIVTITLVALLWTETLPQKYRRTTPVSALTGLRNLRRAFSMRTVRALFLVSFFLTAGFMFYTQFFQVYLYETFSWTASDIGGYFAYVGLWIALVQGVVTRAVSKRFRPREVLVWSIPFLALALAAMVVPRVPWQLYLVVPFMALFQGLTAPNMGAAISNRADAESQGEILGLSQSIQSLAMAIPPVIAGLVVTIHPYLPTLIAAGTTLLAWIVFMLWGRADEETFHEA